MPILDIQIVGPIPEATRHDLARRIADAAGAALGSAPQSTWVKLHLLSGADYGENAGGPPPEVRPVFVTVLQADPPQGRALADEVARLTAAIAEACGRPPENVHLIYEPAARGRVAFGGRLRT